MRQKKKYNTPKNETETKLQQNRKIKKNEYNKKHGHAQTQQNIQTRTKKKIANISAHHLSCNVHSSTEKKKT